VIVKAKVIIQKATFQVEMQSKTQGWFTLIEEWCSFFNSSDRLFYQNEISKAHPEGERKTKNEGGHQH